MKRIARLARPLAPLAVLFILHGVSPGLAFAQQAPSLAESLPPSARASYEAARTLLSDGDYAGALLKFEQAYREVKDARLLWNMASCEEKLRHYSKAISLLNRYLQESGASATTEDRTEANELIKTLEPFVTKLLVTSDQPDVAITVDDAPFGVTPLPEPIVVDQGPRRIVGKKAGFADAVKEMTLTGGVPASAILTMVKVVHEGHLTIAAGASDSIAIDGKVVATGRFDGPVTSGGHELRVTAPSMRPYQSELVVADGEARSLSITLQPEAKPSSGFPLWIVIAGGAVVVAGASVGAYFLFRPSDGQPPVGTMQPGTVQLSTFRYR